MSVDVLVRDATHGELADVGRLFESSLDSLHDQFMVVCDEHTHVPIVVGDSAGSEVTAA